MSRLPDSRSAFSNAPRSLDGSAVRPFSLALAPPAIWPLSCGKSRICCPRMLQSFSSLVERYRVVFFDAYGVLKNARGVMQGVPDLLSWLIQQGKDIYVITNDASRSPAQMAASYVHPEHGILIPE